MKLYVENLAREASARELHRLFDKFGCITQLRMGRHADGSSDGTAYLEITKEQAGKAAINKLDTMNFMNRFLRVYEIPNGL